MSSGDTRFRRSSDGASVATLFKIVAHKNITLLLRYPINTLSRFVTMVVFFVVIFFGGQAIAGPALDGTLDGIIIGFFLFTLAYMSYAGLARDIMAEAQWGTLERLFMSPHRFSTVMSAKCIVNVAISFLWAGALLLVMMAITGRWLELRPVSIAILAILTLASVVGVGFVFAGLALIYKRIENVFTLVEYSFIGLIAAPVSQFEILKILPVAQGSQLLLVVMETGISIWEIPATDIVILVSTATFYLLGGYFCFYRASLKARKDGVMGHY